MKKFEYLEHTADIKFQAFGKTLEKCYENAAYAVIDSLCDDKIKKKIKKSFKVKGNDKESLMYNFLEEILFLFETENLLPSKVNVEINAGKNALKCEIKGDLAKKYNIKTHIKSVTYNEMFVKKDSNGWICQVVMDI